VQAALSATDELGNGLAGGGLTGGLLVGELADFDTEQAIEITIRTSGTNFKRKPPARSLARTGDFSIFILLTP